MNNYTQDPIGGAWLAEYARIMPLSPLYVMSGIGGRRETVHKEGVRYETYQENMRPLNQPAAHLQFHLRHEVIHLELLAQVFRQLGGTFIQDWVNAEPTGQYARRAAFLYEWLNGETLEVPSNIGGNYADALSDQKQVTASPEAIIKNNRWRINDNIAGTPHFYPLLVKTEAFERAQRVDIAHMLNELSEEFGEDLLMRSAVWMTLRESKASFAIEGESNQLKRIERFADVMAKRTGRGEIPLNPEALAQLQHEILGDATVIQHYGLRQSPVFVGQTQRGLKEVVYYIAPPSEGLTDKLHGLKTFLDKTAGQSAIMRSAVAAFGFVYIHPLADGNGRVHRFLINDVLRRDGVVAEQLILPVSQVIAEHPSERNTYNKILDQISIPLMDRLQGRYRFDSESTLYPDGIRSNLKIEMTDELEFRWRFWDLTPHVQYLSDLITHVIQHEMHQESTYLKQHDAAREAIKEIAEMPNDYADRIIRSILQTQGKKTNKLLKEIPLLEDDYVWQGIVEAVHQAFEK